MIFLSRVAVTSRLLPVAELGEPVLSNADRHAHNYIRATSRQTRSPMTDIPNALPIWSEAEDW